MGHHNENYPDDESFIPDCIMVEKEDVDSSMTLTFAKEYAWEYQKRFQESSY